MKKMEELREMLCEELEEITKKGSIDERTLDSVDKLTHSIKSIDAITAMEESGKYGRRYDRGYGDRYSRHDGEYGDSYGEDDYSARGRGRNARRDSRGRYASGEAWMDHLSDMEDSAPDERTRREIQKFRARLENS